MGKVGLIPFQFSSFREEQDGKKEILITAIII